MAKKQPRTRKMYKGTYVKKKKPSQKSPADIPHDKKRRPIPTREFLTKEQKNELAKCVKYYSDYTMDQLKEILVRNRQAKTGNLTQLLNRCAEGKLFGGLPSCPKCKSGRLKFNVKNGEYTCTGYMEDEDLKNCVYKTTTAERNSWVE